MALKRVQPDSSTQSLNSDGITAGLMAIMRSKGILPPDRTDPAVQESEWWDGLRQRGMDPDDPKVRKLVADMAAAGVIDAPPDGQPQPDRATDRMQGHSSPIRISAEDRLLEQITAMVGCENPRSRRW